MGGNAVKNVIIGTAGHVDHGKTSLIKAMTGIDADRLMEEKKRGITIDLGFAYMDLANGERVGIVDVPGHERFIRNMLSGAGGVDIALLVVAADEGVMPQTKEHLDILSLLHIGCGVVAVTKTDMVDSDWLELMLEDLKAYLSGSFLQHAAIIPVSAKTGEGIDDLKEEIARLVQSVQVKNTSVPFRLPIDRVFSKQGFGTVITGTLIEGSLSEGDDVHIYPKCLESKVRSIQVHGSDVKTAYAGQRVAVNLLKVKTEDIQKGAVLAKPHSMELSGLLDVKLRVLKEAQRDIRTGSRVHFYQGSSEGLAKVILLDETEKLLPGEEGFAQLLLDESIACKSGDPFVLRFYSPLATIGGGVILDASPKKHKKGAGEALKKLALMSGSDPKGLVEGLVLENSRFAVGIKALAAKSGLSEDTTRQNIEELIKNDKIVKIADELFIHRDFLSALREKFRKDLRAYHLKEALREGLRLEELVKKRLDSFSNAQKESILECVMEGGGIKKSGSFYADSDFSVVLSEKQEKTKNALMEYLLAQGFSPSERPKILADFAKEKETEKILQYLLDRGELLLLAPDALFPKETVEKAKQVFSGLAKDGVSLAAFRDGIESSRKYALLLLEYFDQKGFSQKVDELRFLKNQAPPTR